MLVWLLFALMTAAAVLAVLWPLGKRRENPDPARETGLSVYQDQFAEIERDRARNLIGESEAEAARTEVGRRLLFAADQAAVVDRSENSLTRRRAAALIALAGLPTIAIGLYLLLGSPALPGAPLYSRLAAPPEQQDAALLISRVESRLAEQPDDGRGWEILAPIYLRIGRTNDAVKARANALRLLGATADREADLGEALVADANGVVTAEALAAFERANALDAHHPKARFYRGLAAEQDGRMKDAKTIWQALVNDAPQDAPWLGVVRTALARLEAGGEEPKSGRP
ncbi:MAG TPA: c-type cytochrome biogenesis protein CcmI [Xanthobacteraceae bacterium]|nr:c-type cytochrome biogenesis protein CcmI [Xanthobacteraceae bacterium]